MRTVPLDEPDQLRADTERGFDPSTYAEGVPFDVLARLRRERPIVWVEERPVLGWPGGPGFWLVLRYRDETVFADPDRLDIRRHPNPHLVFGHGPHFCLGAHLARVQMRALFDEVLTRMGHLEYDGPPEYLRSNFQRGVKRLPIRWSRRLRSR